MKAVLASLRGLILGETWTIPVGVAAVLASAVLARLLLPAAVWSHAGGFLIAVLVAIALAVSWHPSAS